MTLLTVAAKNVRHQARNYAAYFFSSTFSVWLFFSYATLLLNPAFQGAGVPEFARQVSVFVEWVVAIFAVIFILYSHSAFLKARQKELSLLTLMGMLPRQVAGIIMGENVVIGLSSTLIGTSLGTLSSKLFFMGIGAMLKLKEPLPFHFAPQAVALTFGLFMGIFVVVSLLSRWQVARLSVAELIRGAAAGKAGPRFAWWKAALCFASIGIAWGLALTAEGADVESRLLPYLILVIVGTYLLFSQGSIALLSWAKRNRAFYLRGTNLVTVSQLAYKMRDNARVLFMVTLLSTIALVVTGNLYAAYAASEMKAEMHYPVHLMAVEQDGVQPAVVEEQLRSHGVQVTGLERVTIIPATHVDNPAPFGIIGLSDYNRWQARFGGEPLTLAPGEGVIPVNEFASKMEIPAVAVGGQRVEVNLKTRVGEHRFNRHLLTFNLAVVEDQRFAEILSRFPGAGVAVHGYQFARWQSSRDAVTAAYQAFGIPVPENEGTMAALSATIVSFDSQKQSYGFVLVLGGFVAVLFFLAAGNMLYFKLLTDLQDDRRQYVGLRKVGIAGYEMNRVVSTQTFSMFLVPFLVAAAHAAALLRMFATGAQFPIWANMGLVTLVYLAAYSVYYVVTRRTYAGALLQAR